MSRDKRIIEEIVYNEENKPKWLQRLITERAYKKKRATGKILITENDISIVKEIYIDALYLTRTEMFLLRLFGQEVESV